PTPTTQARRLAGIATRGLLAAVDVDRVQVVVADLPRGLLARELAVAPAHQRVPPQRTADREAAIAGHAGARLQPLLHLRGVGAPPEHDADDARAAARTRLLGDPLAVGALVEALDLPHVGFDAGLLALGDRAHD